LSAYFAAFTKCLRDWLDGRVLPVAWVYAHEGGDRIGLHTHLILYLPGVFAGSIRPLTTRPSRVNYFERNS
jgi:hypothetical protein